LLVFAAAAGVGVVLAFLLSRNALDQIWVISGLIAGGLFLWYPVWLIGIKATDHIKIGGWLGVAACGLFALAAILNAIPFQGVSPAVVPRSAVAPAVVSTLQPEPTPEPVAAPAESSSPPADWYPDPTGQARLRYWDGNQWTDNTSP
jgi:hypothetical protein